MKNTFSKIILGTVQLGMPYGRGRWADELMPEHVAFEILDAAFERGITTLDTSPEYGLAEARIASYLKANPNKQFHIVSKVKKFIFDTNRNDAGLGFWQKACPFLSLRNCSSLSVLVHHEKDIHNYRVCDVLSEAVVKGNIAQWGVSIYGLEAALRACDIQECFLVQLPFGPINQYFARQGIIQKLDGLEKVVMARSVFAQGRLIELINRVPLERAVLNDVVAELRFAIARLGVSITDFSISLALSEKGISNVVIGVDSPDHLESLSNMMISDELKMFPQALLEKLRAYDGILGKPHLW